MTPQGLAQRWRELVAGSQPPFDEKRSEQRLLATAESSARSRLRGLAIAAAAAVFVGLLVSLPFAWNMMGEDSAGLEQSHPGLIQTPEEAEVVFDHEGSQLRVRPRSRLRVVDASETQSIVHLETGEVFAKIEHRDGKRWRFVAGPFQVLVVGTAFGLSWEEDAQELRLRVDEGRVKLQGPLVEDGKEVSAGEACTVDLIDQRLEIRRLRTPQPPASAKPPSSVAAIPSVPPTSEPKQQQAPAAHADTPAHRKTGYEDYRKLERAGKYAEAVAAALRPGLQATLAAASPDDLLTLARAARHANRQDIATRALLHCRSAFAGSGQAAMAAFLLGRSAAPAEATRWFRTYLSEQPGGTWAREASGRLMESLQRAGQHEAARDAARSYLTKYSNGPHSAYAKRVLEVE